MKSTSLGKNGSGGTFLSSGTRKAIEIIKERFNPVLWNSYVFAGSDGDNFTNDNEQAVAAMQELCDLCSLVGYMEIKPGGDWGSSMMTMYSEKLSKNSNYKQVKIQSKDDIWPRLRETLEIEEGSN